jgi:hypothetical protein
MENRIDLKALDTKIKELRKTAEDIKKIGGEIEAVKRNTNRILASTRMLEITVSDAAEVL